MLIVHLFVSLVSGVGCDFCLWLFLDFSVTFWNYSRKFYWLSLPGDYRVTDEALLAETT